MDRYALLRIAMSREEAREMLGFPPGFNPSDTEVNKAFRDIIRSDPSLHVDRGGDTEKFIQLEAAKAELLGDVRPTYDRRPESAPAGVSYTRPPKKEVTFQQAETKAGIPSGVTWLFVTPSQRGEGWSGDESSKSDLTFVAYGRTDSKHVFVGANHFTRQDNYVGGTEDQDIWRMESFEVSIKGDEGSQPAWLYGEVIKALKRAGFRGKFNSKVMDARDWSFSQRLPVTTPVSIKHWLVNSGQVAGDAPSVVGRKQVVELALEKAMREAPGLYEAPHTSSNFWDGRYHGDYYRLNLILNGKPVPLSERDWQAFYLAKFGGKKGLDAVYGDYFYGGEKKQLTRLRQGKVILQWMIDNLKDLTPDAISVLQAAVVQMKG